MDTSALHGMLVAFLARTKARLYLNFSSEGVTLTKFAFSAIELSRGMDGARARTSSRKGWNGRGDPR